MKRAIIIVIDSMGVGAMPDAPMYNDTLKCNTLGNVAKFNNGLNLPNLQKLGLGNIIDVMGVSPCQNPIACYGKMAEISEGKDTTTGHWEMAGLILDEPFKVYPNGFPKKVIEKFVQKTGCTNFLGNYPASGTAIINDLGHEHIKTGFPIVYTSADSVFQIACDVDTVPLKTLYSWCESAREILNGEYNVSRVIARPFEIVNGEFKRISKDRRDYSVAPYKQTVLNAIANSKNSVIGIGKIEDIFVKSGITHAVHTGSNKEGLELTIQALKNKLCLDNICICVDYNHNKCSKQLIFTNLVDTDMLYGHRNDAIGYGKALEEIDEYLGKILPLIGKDDLLIITADHGCDPTVDGTDHTREYVPVMVYNPEIEPQDLGLRPTFAQIADSVADWLDVPFETIKGSFL
ncbi:MAG: phosphopentomutase [Candidatus Gastranaerophilales bacterium]|nr:phosphopentomutase [Candidatus Gastranaerophilales bacterium]